jgi:DNA polymerase I
MTEIKKLMIWDGNNVFRRVAGFKGLARLSYNGRLTGAIHGTIKSIVSDIETYRPDECAIVFDGAGARISKQKIYAGYKAHRVSSMPDELHHQMIAVRDILKAAGLCVLQKSGVDADDAIGALAQLPKRSTLINSNDKDFLQSVTTSCSQIRNLGQGPELWDVEKVLRRWNIRPDQVADYLALCGDSVDGIPGLAGCGPVTARELLGQYESLQGIVKNRNVLPEKWKKAVNKQKDELHAFYRLTKLDTSVISDNALQTIIPRLRPKEYSKELIPLCTSNGLVWIQKWFASHRPTVVSRAQGLWT